MNKIRTPTYKVKVIKSNISGLGVRAEEKIVKNKFIIEYHGKILTMKKANEKGGKYLFEVNNKRVIDGSVRSNIARYVNHSCVPNAESRPYKGRVYIYSIKPIKKGEEITYDYGEEYYHDILKGQCKCLRCSRKKKK